eukprot:CAMPEP_0206583690 /NCGR_PEP_ID=MMETSP0325_2-20121206/35256_1 /ASSEMBLY_ACC=CAM_ASM_000347 /TAXON_ID=2866 /ORGANISM="Crypthecodinium cohnii, Strain Seligo" /LENGTH=194 /DNA_ID=CAMNT_0054090663 /DNA_START=176 /DNA_END=756 /DNA_ORIENTATION=-
MVSMAHVGAASHVVGMPPMIVDDATALALSLSVRRDGIIAPEAPPSSIGKGLVKHLADGRMVSPLHPATARCFDHSRKRQAYGTVAPRTGRPITQPARNPIDHEDEARRNWFKVYANDSEARAHKDARLHPARPRSLGASGPHCHAQMSETGWHWQSWRGWTTAGRSRHESVMREMWQKEATERWKANQEHEAS